MKRLNHSKDHLFHLFCFIPFWKNDGIKANAVVQSTIRRVYKKVSFDLDLLLLSLTQPTRDAQQV